MGGRPLKPSKVSAASVPRARATREKTRLTLARLASSASHRWGCQPFLEVWSSRSAPSAVSFESFALLVESAGALLRQHGAERGSKLAVLCHACPDSLALSLAMSSLGGIVVNLNWRHPEDTLQQLLRGVDCELMVTGRGLAATARWLCEAVGNVDTLLLLEQSEAELADSAPSTAEYAVACGPRRSTRLSVAAANPRVSRGDAAAAWPELDDVAVVMFTSGTSALPKAVPLTHRNLLWSCNAKAQAEARMLGVVRDGHRGTLAFLPTFHVIGFTNNFLANLAAGVRCCVHCDAPHVPLTPRLLLRACDELRPTLLDTVPALLEALLPLDHAEAAPLRRCAAVLYGGSALSATAAAAYRALGVSVPARTVQTLCSTRLQPHASRLQPHACR